MCAERDPMQILHEFGMEGMVMALVSTQDTYVDYMIVHIIESTELADAAGWPLFNEPHCWTEAQW